MNNKLLLPRGCRLAGYIILPFAITLLIAVAYFDFSIPHFTYHPDKGGGVDRVFGGKSEMLFSKNFAADYSCTVAMIFTFISLFMIAFSKLKHEDEYVAYIRLRALQLSVYANYIILILTSLLFFGFSFLVVMQINLFTILVLFILIFNYSLYIKPRLSKNGTI